GGKSVVSADTLFVACRECFLPAHNLMPVSHIDHFGPCDLRVKAGSPTCACMAYRSVKIGRFGFWQKVPSAERWPSTGGQSAHAFPVGADHNLTPPFHIAASAELRDCSRSVGRNKV